jgi:cystathionine beta-synthase
MAASMPSLAGIGRFLAKHSPKSRMILADPLGSALAPFVESGHIPKAGSWSVEGIGEDFVPPNADLKLVPKRTRFLIRTALLPRANSFGWRVFLQDLRVGPCWPQRYVIVVSRASHNESLAWSATLAQSTSQRCSIQYTPLGKAGTTSVTVRYVMSSSVGFLKAKKLWCVLKILCAPRSCACVLPTSRMPVVDGDRIVGLVDESDMLGALLEGSAGAFDLPVKDVMVTRLEPISADAPIRELVPLFRRDLVAIVMDGNRFLGIATRLDLVNYFRIVQMR